MVDVVGFKEFIKERRESFFRAVVGILINIKHEKGLGHRR
jgi:hypothetical protein